jgi:siroheme synthase (precorrin-2 oxidase/ferrochelatase)
MEQSKFSGALANLNKPQVKEKVQPSIDETAEIIQPTIERGRGRPRSKSSDPDYQSTTVILRKLTKRRAAHMLEDREMGKDLSELIEELLTEWLESQS